MVMETRYAPLVPYYLIANGGILSDEYQLFSYENARTEQAALTEKRKEEELLESLPQGVVFAHCADGDHILLCEDGKVIRFSHEEPISIAEWPSLAQFIVEAIHD